MRFSTTLRNARLQVLLDALDANASPGQLRLYSGVAPATGGAATTLLATLTLSKPAGTIANGTLTLSAVTAGAGTAAATAQGTAATWARFVDGAGTFVADLTVGIHLLINSPVVVTGQLVSILPGSQITEGNF